MTVYGISSEVQAQPASQTQRKVTSNRRVEVKRARPSFSKVIVASALAPAEFITPIYGQVLPPGEIIHPLAFPDQRGFLKLVSDIGRVSDVWERGNLRLFEVDCPPGWRAFSGAMPWSSFMDYVEALDVVAKHSAIATLRVEVEDRIPIFVTDTVLPRVDFLTFMVEKNTEAFCGWCAGPYLDVWARDRRRHIVVCRGDNVSEQVRVSRETLYA